MKPSTKVRIKKLLKPLVEQILREGPNVRDQEILKLVKQLKQMDDMKQKSGKSILDDPDSRISQIIIQKLQKYDVIDDENMFIYGHPLMDEIDQIWSA